jgi:hypothetical protein
MTVRELIEKLEQMPQDLPVFWWDYAAGPVERVWEMDANNEIKKPCVALNRL